MTGQEKFERELARANIEREVALALQNLTDAQSPTGETTMRTQADRELALACLTLANELPGMSDELIVARAEAFFAFVTGQTPRDQINAALDRAGVK